MILCIVGPTGVGKTKLSIELAKKYNAIIINCDAMQVYKGMDIGTAKVRDEEKEGIMHYIIDFVDARINYTVADYQIDARKILEENKDKNIIFVGGTGLYLKAALWDYRFAKEDKKENYDDYSNEELLKLCKEKNPNCDIHVNNRKRLIRYLQREENDVQATPIYKAIYIGLTTNREKLYEVINNRVDKMIDNGLVEEVRKFYNQNIRSKAIKTAIGYKEIYDYLDKKCTLDEAILKIKQNSRHYAKRQYTFFNHQLPVEWFDVDYENFAHTIKRVEEYIEKQEN